ncbi:MAG: hypothetical protein AAF368_04320 [Planctomycetota bacterium]
MRAPLCSLLFALGLAASAEAQSTYVFDINSAASNFTWTGSSDLGVVNPNPTNMFQIFGTISIDLDFAAGQAIGEGQIVAANIQLNPEFAGAVPNPIFPSQNIATLQVMGQVFDAASDPFVVDAAGAFTTDVVLTTTTGTITVMAFGGTFPSDLSGIPSDPATILGQIDRDAVSLDVSAPLVATFGFVDPGTNVAGSFTVTGTIDATYSGLYAPSFCRGDGGDGGACTPCPCGNEAPAGTQGGCLNAVGGSAELLASGSPSAANDTLRMEMRCGSPNTFAILSSGASRAPGNAANPCFGLDSGLQSPVFDGLRCAVQAVQRHGTRPTDANGDVGVTTNGWGPPNGPAGGLMAQGGFLAGQTRHYQVVYREDVAAGCMRGQNTTQGVTLTFLP